MPEKSPERAKLVDKLGEVPLFSGLSPKELSSIADGGKEVSFETGKVILKEGESGLGFLLVLKGRVEVRKRDRVIATMGPGGFFGEMTVFDDRPRSADVVALEPTTCFGMTSWSFIAKMQSNPSIALAVIKELVRRLRALEQTPSN